MRIIKRMLGVNSILCHIGVAITAVGVAFLDAYAWFMPLLAIYFFMMNIVSKLWGDSIEES